MIMQITFRFQINSYDTRTSTLLNQIMTYILCINYCSIYLNIFEVKLCNHIKFFAYLDMICVFLYVNTCFALEFDVSLLKRQIIYNKFVIMLEARVHYYKEYILNNVREYSYKFYHVATFLQIRFHFKTTLKYF